MATTETAGVDLREVSQYTLAVIASRLHLESIRHGKPTLTAVASIIHAGQWLTADDIDGLGADDLIQIATLFHRVGVDLVLDLSLVVGTFNHELAIEIRDAARLHHSLTQGATA